MFVDFKNKKMKKNCEDQKRLCIKHGSQQAEQIIQRINELKAAKNLYDISKLPHTRLHPLSGNYRGHFSVGLKQPFRLIFLPLDGTQAEPNSITSIKIINECTDYH